MKGYEEREGERVKECKVVYCDVQRNVTECYLELRKCYSKH
jgi:hypothetical protein